jgi:hypothetical protein
MSAIDDIIAALKEDAQAPFPKYPSQALPALRNGAVVERLSRRLDAGTKLRGVRALDYDFQTGLNRLCCFEFEAPLGRGKDTLVLLDHNCDLVGIVDPFDPDQPNRMIPPLSTIGGAMPFILERPSASRDLPFNEEDLAPQDSRARAFMARTIGGFGGVGGGGVFETDPCGPEAQQTNCTYCSFWMQTLKYMPAGGRNIYHADCEQMDTNADDCGTMA